MSETVQLVKKYYGETLKGSKDLLTDACCTTDAMPGYARAALAKVHPEVRDRYYGCGLVLPEKLNGCQVLDLGSGAGQDCYILSQLVGEQGRVVGVDMTEEQLNIAKRFIDHHRDAFGYKDSNVSFLQGYLEKMEELPLEDNQFDVIVSNCVINLCEDKEAVLKSCFRLLKEGGELYFSDVYSDRRVPDELRKDPVLYGECLSGALYTNDFFRLAHQVGFVQPRRVTGRPLEIRQPAVQAKLRGINFASVTYRLFKVATLEPQCEDYGQAVRYEGGIDTSPDRFELDPTAVFEQGRVTPVCGNTFDMLAKSRFSDSFSFYGDRKYHFGSFACHPTPFSDLKVEPETKKVSSCC